MDIKARRPAEEPEAVWTLTLPQLEAIKADAIAQAVQAEREACREFVGALAEGRLAVLNLFDNVAYERDAAAMRQKEKPDGR